MRFLFWNITLPFPTNNKVKSSNYRFSGEREHTTVSFSFSMLNSVKAVGLRIQQFAYTKKPKITAQAEMFDRSEKLKLH